MALNRSLADFVDDVGPAERGPVCVSGGRTKWSVGGVADPETRQVRAPAGIVAYQPAEMTVTVGAGTTLTELHDELAAHGQTTVLEGPPGATVGGVLVVGHNGIRSLRTGALRDALLMARYASSEGRLIVAGGPTVKNVTGFDLCRLLVGSLGTLGLLGEVILRTRPRPETSLWLAGAADPHALFARLYRPSSILWDGTTSWVLLEGYEADVRSQAREIERLGMVVVDHGPTLPPHRFAGPPSSIASFGDRHPDAGRYVAQVGVGVVHADRVPARAKPPAAALDLHRRLRAEFDPTRRLNPGRDPLAV